MAPEDTSVTWSRAPVDAVFFDATGTLIHLPGGVGSHYAAVAERFGARVDAARLERAFGKAWNDLPPPPVTGVARPDDDRGWWRALVDRVAADAGLRFDDAGAFFDELYAHFAAPGVWKLYPEVEEVLDALQSRYRLAVVSNFDGRLRTVLEELGIFSRFDALVISSEVGADKPAPEIFAAACRALAVEPDAVIHVGDDPELDWAAAERAGMRAFRLDRKHNTLRDLLEMLG